MLNTPFGRIAVAVDGIEVPYEAEKIENADFCSHLDGRYMIRVEKEPDEKPHVISCKIEGYLKSPLDNEEGGENLELKNFYKNGGKLSIGMECDVCIEDGERMADYDYNVTYFDDGVGYTTDENTFVSEFKFAAAWIENVTEETDIETYLGADPGEIELEFI